MVLFLDEYFAINFVMDFIIVHFTAKLTGLNPDMKKQSLAAFLGSIASCIYGVSAGNTIILQVLFHFVTSFIMTFALLGKGRIDEYIKILLVLNVCCMFAAGIMNYIYYTGILSKLLRHISDKKIHVFVISAVVTFFVLNKTTDIITKLKKSYSAEVYDVTICLGGREITVKGIVDTGNTLSDPFTMEPVHIIEARIMKDLIREDDINKLKLRIIPFHSIGKNGILKAIKAEKIVIHKDREVIYIEPVLALYQGKLSANENYQMLLNRNGK